MDMIFLNKTFILSTVVLIISLACKPKEPPIIKEEVIKEESILIEYDSPPYNLDHFDELINLDNALMEISGLSYVDNDLLAINDELGIIYNLDPHDGSIIDRFKFASRGDYEGIQQVGSRVYVIKSDGNIYHYDLTLNKAGSNIIETGLSLTNDVEGLAYDEKSDRFLIACKGQSRDERFKKANVSKSICYYIPDSAELECEIEIHDDELLGQYNKQMANKRISKSANDQNIKRLKSFAPSGIAIHPANSELYILSAKGSLLIGYKDQKVRWIHLLDDKIIKQPEGLCFDEKYNLFISTEGRGLVAKLFKYLYKK